MAEERPRDTSAGAAPARRNHMAPVLRSCKSTLQPVAEPRGHRLRRGAGDTLSSLDSPCFRVAASTMPKVFSMAEYQQMLDRFISARRYRSVTIGAAWIFKGGEGEELWIASDSRLSGDGNIWDDCPKLLPLPRRDAVAGFSGSTAQAYPLLLQIANAISSYRAAADGTLEFFNLVSHLEHVVNAMMGRIEADPAIVGNQSGQREFATVGDALVLGGYSRAQGGLVLRTLRYQGSVRKWTFERVRPKSSLGRNKTIAVFGDQKSRSRFLYLLRLYLEERGALQRDVPLRLEPLAVIAAMLRLPSSSAHRIPMDHRPVTIGGAPQILQLFPGAQATTVAVQWEVEAKGGVYLQGRRTLDYENLNVPLVTFNDMRIQIHAPGHWPVRLSGHQAVPSENDVSSGLGSAAT